MTIRSGISYTVPMQDGARWKLAILYSLLVFVCVLAIRSCTVCYEVPAGALGFSPVAGLTVPGGAEEAVPLEWYRSGKGGRPFQTGMYRLCLDLEPSLEGIDTEAEYVLVLPGINGAAIRVYLDGAYLGSQGDLRSGRSSIWNSIKTFQIHPGLLRSDSKIQMEILGLYEAGIVRQPYIMEHGAARLRLAFLYFISSQAIWLLCGAILVMGLAIMAIGGSSPAGLDGRMILGLAAVCTGFFLADFLTLEFLPISLLTFKKAVVILRHLAAILFTLGFLKLLGRKPDWFAKLFSLVQLVSAVLALVTASVLDLKTLYTYTYLTIIPFLFYLLFLFFCSRQEGPGRSLLLVGVSIGVVTALHDILLTLLIPNSILISHFGFMMLTLGTTAFVVLDIMQNYRQLMIEKRRAEAYREASLHDPLTGIFNRSILPLVRESLSGPFAILIADLDNFKSINDRYGHQIGDRVLRDFVSVMTRVFRRGDFLVRTGGDEFLAILPACPVEAIDELKNKLENELGRSRISILETPDPADETAACQEATDSDRVIGYSASIGSAHFTDPASPDSTGFDALIAEADRKLYEVKRSARRP